MNESVLMKVYVSIFIFFFFQAEDGIRDGTVTGVQTCALPIYKRRPRLGSPVRSGGRRLNDDSAGDEVVPATLSLVDEDPDVADVEHEARDPRSEERRVGKECRSRWSPDHEKKREREGG